MGPGRGAGGRTRGPPFPLPRSARTSVGSPGWGWGPLVSPRCRPSGCSWRGGESAILSGKHLFWLRLAPCRKPPARRGSVQPGGGLQGVRGRAPAGLRAWLLPAPEAPTPWEHMHWNVRGEGARGGREGGLGGGPSLRSPLRARPSGRPSSPAAPGRVPGCSLSPAPSAQWLKGEGSPGWRKRGVCGGEGPRRRGAWPGP